MRMTATQYLKAVLSFVGVAAVTVAAILAVIAILRIDVLISALDRLMSIF
jgi:hypothetical protein